VFSPIEGIHSLTDGCRDVGFNPPLIPPPHKGGKRIILHQSLSNEFPSLFKKGGDRGGSKYTKPKIISSYFQNVSNRLLCDEI